MLIGIFPFFPGVVDIHPQTNSEAHSATRSEFREGLTAPLLQLLYREAIPAAPHPLTIKKAGDREKRLFFGESWIVSALK